MTSNSKRRFAAMTARLLVLLVAVCMVITVAPHFAQDVLPVASADAVSYQVPNGAAASAITSKLATYPSGTTVNVLLSGDVGLDASIVIPTGLTVNFYMNGKTISKSESHYQAGSLYAFTNNQNATLNIYSGSPSQPNLASGNSTISLTNDRTDMSRTDGHNEHAETDYGGVQNAGTVTVNKGVKISVFVRLEYGTGGDNENNTNVNLGATGVWNTNNSATCVINAAEITCYTRGRCANANSIWHTNRSGSNRSLSYGVYGGIVTVNGDAKFSVEAQTSGIEGKSGSDEGSAKTTGVAFGVCTSQKITVNGGTFTYKAHVDGANDGMKNATSHYYMGGICYSSVIPDLTDGTINTMEGNIKTTTEDMGNISLSVYEAPVGKMPTLPVSGHAVATEQTYRNEAYNYNITGATKGQFYDESGNVYDGAYSTTDGSHPTAIVRGAAAGTYRVHVVYRFWQNSNKSAIYTAEGNPGYSYKPTGDGTNIVNTAVKLNGLTANSKFVKTASSAISYNSGGASKNDYYWKQFNMAYATTANWFSDYDVTASGHKGTVFKSFVDSATNSSCGGGTESPIYIFVDYYRATPSSLIASVGTANSATVTYTGTNIKASAINLKIKDAVFSTDYTAEYNIDFNASNKIPVSFSWTGTTTAQVSVSSGSNHELPTEAGTYQVTMSLADYTEYDPNDCDPAIHKNRNALAYTFTLNIEKAPVFRGNLPESVTLTYGEKLNEKLTFLAGSYTAKGVTNLDVEGRFSFTNPQDGGSYKPVGSNTVSVTWTPAETSTNYCETTFTVAYTVNKAAIVISANAASVEYGNGLDYFTAPYGITVSGLVANDNNDTAKSQIAAAMDYMILVNGAYTYYSPDDIGVGAYNIRARVKQAEVPAVLSNYTYSYADLVEGYDVNQLTVTKRNLIVKATAVSREYVPDNYNVSVTYELISGRYQADDVRFTTGSGSINPNTAGTQTVYGATISTATQCMTGAKAGNYQISELTFATGTSLTVEITKAMPTVNTPVVSDMYYQRSRVLSDIPLTSAGSSVEGRWEWADLSQNPTVNTSLYAATFIPTDSTNYAEKTVDVTINVRPTPVKITYNGTVEYGDDVPNVTAYTYIAEQDPSFSIDVVETTGNIQTTTTYRKGYPVTDVGYPVNINMQNYVDSAGNYTFTAEDGKITVVPRNIVFTVPNQTIEYGENFVTPGNTVAPNYDASRLVDGDDLSAITNNGSMPIWNYSTGYRYSDNYQVGNYYFRATIGFTPSPNYNVTVVDGTLTVAPAPLTIKANNITLPYNSDVPADLATAYSFVGAKRGEGLDDIVKSGAITVDTNYRKGSVVNAEGYLVQVDISGAEISNYTVTIESGKITVIKATPVIRTYPTATIIYTQTLADAVFTGAVIDGNVPGEFVYNAAATQPAYSNEPYTNYTAAFIPDDTANYNTVTGLTIALTVSKMPVSGALAVTGIPMKGETLTVDVSGLTPDEPGVYTFVWTMNGSQIGTGTELALTDAHVGNEIVVTATAQGYYEGQRSYTVTTIAPELTSVTEIINGTAYSNYFDLTGLSVYGGTTELGYDAAQHAVTLLQKSATLSTAVVGTITVKYNGSTQIPTNAGLYTVSVDVATPDLSRINEAGVTTYSPASGLVIGTLNITKAPYNVTVTVADKVYDGTNAAAAQSVNESGAMTLAGGMKDDVAFDTSRVVYTFEDANVGTGKSVAVGGEKLKGDAAANYTLNFSLANGAKANITKRTLEVTIDPVEREYQKDYYDVDLAFNVNTSTIAPADTSASVYVNEALAAGTVDDYHAGLRRVTVSGLELAGAKKDNYDLSVTNLADLSVMIEKATPSYPLPNTGTVTYDSGRTLSNISLGDSRWSWADSVANVIPEAGTHEFTAVFTPDDNENYAAVNYVVPLTVGKAPVVIKAASFTTVYGDYAPTYFYTVTGLTGADTIKTSVGGYVILNCSYEPGSPVGDYSIVLSGGFNSNNYSFTYENGTLSIVKRPAYVTAVAQSREYEPGNLNVSVTFSELTNIYGSDASNISLDCAQPLVGTIEDADAGLKHVSYTMPGLTGAKADNYTLTVRNPDLIVEIQKARIPGVVLPTSGTVKYGAKLSTTEFTSSYDAKDSGTFSMENPMSTPAAVGTTNNVYKVVFTPNNTINYATISDYITLTVITSDLNVELSLSGAPEVGKKLYVSTNDLPADAYEHIEFKWYRLENRTDDVRDGQLVANDTAEYVVTERDADHYIACVATNKSSSPYNIDAKVTSDSTVSKKSMSLWERLLKWFYKVLSSLTQLFGKI